MRNFFFLNFFIFFLLIPPNTPISHFNDLDKNNNLVNPNGFFLLLLVVLKIGEINTVFYF